MCTSIGLCTLEFPYDAGHRCRLPAAPTVRSPTSINLDRACTDMPCRFAHEERFIIQRVGAANSFRIIARPATMTTSSPVILASFSTTSSKPSSPPGSLLTAKSSRPALLAAPAVSPRRKTYRSSAIENRKYREDVIVHDRIQVRNLVPILPDNSSPLAIPFKIQHLPTASFRALIGLIAPSRVMGVKKRQGTRRRRMVDAAVSQTITRSL